jgi:hypothetical protein
VSQSCISISIISITTARLAQRRARPTHTSHHASCRASWAPTPHRPQSAGRERARVARGPDANPDRSTVVTDAPASRRAARRAAHSDSLATPTAHGVTHTPHTFRSAFAALHRGARPRPAGAATLQYSVYRRAQRAGPHQAAGLSCGTRKSPRHITDQRPVKAARTRTPRYPVMDAALPQRKSTPHTRAALHSCHLRSPFRLGCGPPPARHSVRGARIAHAVRGCLRFDRRARQIT